MARFDYLKGKELKKQTEIAETDLNENEGKGRTLERVEPIYVRRETVKAVWREIKDEGGESVSELVEDLLLRWLKERQG